MFNKDTWFRDSRQKLGTVLSIDHPSTVEIARDAGWDWLWLDAEHGRFNERSAADACAITQGYLPTFVRVPDALPTTLKRYLDAGADGIIVPQVSSVAEARDIAKAAQYPPEGERSVGIARAHGYGVRFAEALQRRNYGILLQIETAAGVEEADRIAAEPYVDAIVIGPYDLSASFGVPGDIGSAKVQAATARVLAACTAAGKSCGIFAADAGAARAYLQQGFSMVATGIDARLLARAHAALRAELR